MPITGVDVFTATLAIVVILVLDWYASKCRDGTYATVAMIFAAYFAGRIAFYGLSWQSMTPYDSTDAADFMIVFAALVVLSFLLIVQYYGED